MTLLIITLLFLLYYVIERYIAEGLFPPKAIIISGDLVNGVGINQCNWESELINQYRLTEEFLTQLSDLFLAGDRRNLVIVPGNHDVCWNSCLHSMNEIQRCDYPQNLKDEIFKKSSMYRWSWNQLALFKIVDYCEYEKRLNAYWDFLERFYCNVNLTFPIQRNRGYNLFELDSHRLLVWGLESTFRNDCFSDIGSFGSLAQCYKDIQSSGKRYFANMAVWHHGLNGSPLSSDFIDVTEIEELAAYGVMIGLHGHNHRSNASSCSVRFDEGKLIAIIGAGSLSAGARELPRGVNRQYNILTFDEGYGSVTVHVREMSESTTQFSKKRNGIFSEGEITLPLYRDNEIWGNDAILKAHRESQIIEKAESLFHSGQFETAIVLLLEEELSANEHARRIILEAGNKGNLWEKIVAVFGDDIKSNAEEMSVVEAYIQTQQFNLASSKIRNSTFLDENIIHEFQRRIITFSRVKNNG